MILFITLLIICFIIIEYRNQKEIKEMEKRYEEYKDIQ